MHKLLIANRGEIAVRVIRTAREMGIRTVAVYSEADAEAMHVALADEAILLGPPEAAQSYLSIPKLLDAIQQSGADAVHPGYGFLSERPEFAEACSEIGVSFVGPSADAMRRLGSKIDAKTLAVRAGVPIVPGYFEAGATPEVLIEAANQIGYPVMLKASAGGGGRGMRIVRDPSHFHEQLTIASDEALKSFGDGAMMVEKLIERPRHIEVQVLADHHGNVACLFERECSIQRRHQKLLEEAPSTLNAEFLWPQMREAARALIREAEYTNAGTVEFIVDAKGESFFFLEVNARLQVEHPVTEAVTGLDLVREQIEVADGKPLSFSPSLIEGDRSVLSGHAIEARVIAEDPGKNFLPSAGKLLAWSEPNLPGVRIDTGYRSGGEVPQFYDSLIAKVICHGSTRDQAIDRLRIALQEFHILGVATNVAYLLEIIDHPDFRSGDFDTGFLERNFAEWKPGPVPLELGQIAENAVSTTPTAKTERSKGVWDSAQGFRNVRA